MTYLYLCTKAALRPVVAELSERLVRTNGVALRVIGWPDDVRPGVNVDPQVEINRQIGAEFDIYLGILPAMLGCFVPVDPTTPPASHVAALTGACAVCCW